MLGQDPLDLPVTLSLTGFIFISWSLSSVSPSHSLLHSGLYDLQCRRNYSDFYFLISELLYSSWQPTLLHCSQFVSNIGSWICMAIDPDPSSAICLKLSQTITAHLHCDFALSVPIFLIRVLMSRKKEELLVLVTPISFLNKPCPKNGHMHWYINMFISKTCMGVRIRKTFQRIRNSTCSWVAECKEEVREGQPLLILPVLLILSLP